MQGEIGLGAAIGWFTAHGYWVSIPLCDNQPYDLIVDDGTGPQRVQVKTTTRRGPYGNFLVMLETAGGNQSFHTRKPFDNTKSDLLFVLADDGAMYVIPSAKIACRRTLTLCSKYAQYQVVGGGFEPP